jgi:hypothetical protein
MEERKKEKKKKILEALQSYNDIITDNIKKILIR